MLAPAETAQALRRAGLRHVDDGSRRRAEYSSDASPYRVVPSVVAFPESTDDLVAAVATCRALGVPLTMRGAGTSIAGNAIGAGVILDTRRHLGRVLSLDPEAREAIVEPGVVLDGLQRALAPHGLRFGPDPSTHSRCTIGGMIGNNACGSRALAFGRTADNIEALDVVTGGGEVLALRRRDQRGPVPGNEQGECLSSVHAAVMGDLATIRTESGRFRRQVSGYSLEHLLPENGFDVARFLVGTEGTCAVTMSATLRLVEQPAATALLVLGYADMAEAADAVPSLLPFGATAIEGLDSRIVDVVRAAHGSAAVPDLPRGSGWLMVECPGGRPAQARDLAVRIAEIAGALDALVVTDAAQARALWRIREDGSGLAGRPTATTRAHAGWEDSAVPPERLGAYLRDFDRLLTAHGLSGVPYGHFGEGCLHVRIDFPLRHDSGVDAYRRFLMDAADLVASHGGSMSGEHGDGRARSELLPRMYSAAALGLMRRIKDAFDPDGILNPGIIIEPVPVDADLRLPAAPPMTRGLALSYPGDSGDFTWAVHRCTGVGKCVSPRSEGHDVMCPSFIATGDERDSTRGRARVLQEMANGSSVRGWSAPEVLDALDLCLACRGCAVDCPTGVDMATYRAEALHHRYAGRRRPLHHYTLGRLPQWLALAARAPRLANVVMRSPLRRPLARLAGIDGRRSLPALATAGIPVTDVDPTTATVVLWADTFTRRFAPDIIDAATEVLTAAGQQVYVLDSTACCGLTMISTGQLDDARTVVADAVQHLLPWARRGLPIIGLEPSCTAALREDAVRLVPGEATQVVAASMRTLAEVLESSADWRAPDLTGLAVVAQPHCHHHAVMGWSADERILASTGATIVRVGGCCGLAGDFGMVPGHRDVSIAIAGQQLLPALQEHPDAVVLADGFSCRTQVADLAGRPARHLAHLLAGRHD